MKIMGVNESLGRLQGLLDTHTKVYYVRFGDGDILLMSNSIKQTSGNKQKTSAGLRFDLLESFNIDNPLYLRAASGSYPTEPGMVVGLFAPFGNREQLDKILSEQLDKSVKEFFNPALFHYLAVFKPKLLRTFIDKYIRNQSKMFIGGCSKENMEKFLGPIDVYVKTPLVSSCDSIDQWWEKIEKNLEGIKVIVLAAGHASRVIAKRLWNMNVNAHCIDIGSVVDPVDGKFDTRTCWKMKGREVMEYFCNV